MGQAGTPGEDGLRDDGREPEVVAPEAGEADEPDREVGEPDLRLERATGRPTDRRRDVAGEDGVRTTLNMPIAPDTPRTYMRTTQIAGTIACRAARRWIAPAR